MRHVRTPARTPVDNRDMTAVPRHPTPVDNRDMS